MMSKEDWAKVEAALSGTYGAVILMVDGRRVTFQRHMKGKNSLTNVCYVDGSLQGSWLGTKNDHPEQLYMRPVGRFLYSTKYRNICKKMSKVTRKFMGIKPGEEDTKLTVFVYDYPSAALIKRHYTKTFTSIELLEINGMAI